MNKPNYDFYTQQSRFSFGKNWQNFLLLLDEERIIYAENSLCEMLNTKDLKGLRFLDIGSGSGLFSLAARRLGAYVHSFDYDEQSVLCTQELRRRYYPNDPNWQIEQGSILNESYIKSLKKFDIVYSWGVLHHTGDMWHALELAATLVSPGGKLFIAIYNQQTPLRHRITVKIKRTYVDSGKPIQALLVGCYFIYTTSLEVLVSLLHGRSPLARIREYGRNSRGMSWWHDIVDWVGGYPYEAAKPEEIFDFLLFRGFQLQRLFTEPGHGCNQFVFVRNE